MLTVAIAAAIIGLIAGIINGCTKEDLGAGIRGFFGGLIVGALSAVLVLIMASCYVADKDDCEITTNTYDLMPYVIESGDYYVYLSNSNNGIVTNLQYLDDDASPQSLSLIYNLNYYYGVAKTPSIEITSYKSHGGLWYFAPASPSPQYKVYLPDKTAIYQGIN